MGAATAVGAMLGGLPGAMGGAAVGGFLGTLAEQAINGENLCLPCAVQSALIEGLLAGALGLAGKLLGPVLGRLGRAIASSRIGQAMGRAASQARNVAKNIIHRSINNVRRRVGLWRGKPANGTLSNVEARQWYIDQEAKIPSQIDTSKPLKDQARQAFDLRNEARSKARDLLEDQVTADKLRQNEPNMTWEQIVDKYENRGFEGDELWNEIIKGAQKSRTSINESLGVKPK